MIIVELKGGLGNNLFQLGFGLSLARNTGERVCITGKRLPNVKTKTLRKYGIYYLTPLMRKIIFRLNNRFRFVQKINDPIWSNVEVNRSHKNLFIEGYWAFHNYACNVKDIISNIIDIKEGGQYAEYLKTIRSKDSVFIHVRAGDYLQKENTEIFKTLGIDYYLNAIQRMRLIFDEPNFFLFSDDAQRAEKMFQGIPKVTVVSGTGMDVLEEFNLMKNCKGAICANSTFSWWAARLRKNEHGVTILPKKWYNLHEAQQSYEQQGVMYLPGENVFYL